MNENMVLGITDESFEQTLDYVYFQKYFQRIQKKTGNFYKSWVKRPENSALEDTPAQVFERLDNSKFRSGFHLKQKDIDYINEKGMDTIRDHARDFIAKREAPAVIPNDGKQKPTKGHPVCSVVLWLSSRREIPLIL
jgi:hypothetical protein